MDKVNFEFFDFFGAALPGIPTFIIVCFVVNNMPFSYDAISIFLKEVTIYQAAFILFASYAIGFCLHYPAYELFQILAKCWGNKRTDNLAISIGKRENELVLIRQKSPENFKLITKFLALRQMSYSMVFSLLVFCISLLILTYFKANWGRNVISVIALTIIFGILFLRKSVAFHQRIQEMITEAYLLSLTL